MLCSRSDMESKRRSPILVDVTGEPIEDSELISIYRWLDTLEFSCRRKTSSHRDFADGVMMAELVAHYIPSISNPLYYPRASATSKKLSNWEHIQRNIFRKIGFSLTPKLLHAVVEGKPGMIERVLKPLRQLLLLGSGALVGPSSRLEAVKPRFLDFAKTDKSPIQQRLKEELKLRSRSNSKVNTSRRPSTPSRPATTSSFAGWSSPVVRTSRLRENLRKAPTSPSSPPKSEDSVKRPPTARSSHSPSPPRDSSTSASCMSFTDYTEDEDEERNRTRFVSPRRHRLPSSCSWLPSPQETNHLCPSKNAGVFIEDGKVDDEIYSSGYKENEANPVTTVALPQGDQSKESQRKVKRVLKYEYREEYVLNGMINVQLPRAEELTEEVRRNRGGDPKCRGYGFV